MNLLTRPLRHLLSVALLGSTLFASMAASAADSTWDQIQQTKQLRLGVAPGDPWYYKDPLSGKWTGVGYLIGEKIAADLGVKLVPVETTYGNVAAAIQANQLDLILVLDATAERKKALAFPQAPLLFYKQGILVKDGIKADTWEDLNKPDIRIGVALGTATDRDLTKRLPNAQIQRFANTDETIAAFMSHRIDGFAFYHPALAIAMSHIRSGKLVIPTPVVQLSSSGGMRIENDPRFKDFINSEFIKLNADGEIQKIFSDYMASKGLDPNTIPSVTPSQSPAK